jgi:hypothetical protein
LCYELIKCVSLSSRLFLLSKVQKQEVSSHGSQKFDANIHPIRGGRGIREAQVWAAADALLQEGLRPTIERVRQKIGSGSPNPVSPMLERWFATLGKRLDGHGARLADGEAQQLPLAVV